MDTKAHILESAQKLVQQRGFNGFSYADVADEVGIRKASLHHHFATKTDLGLALIASYTKQMGDALANVGHSDASADEKLRQFAALFRGALDADCMCLGGMLAVEVLTLDKAMLPSLKQFFESGFKWLAQVLTEGEKAKLFALKGSPDEHARVLLSGLQGALLLARTTGDKKAFDVTVSLLISSLLRKG